MDYPHEPPWPYDPESRTIDFGPLSITHRGHSTDMNVMGYPVKIWDTYDEDELHMYACADDDGPTFHVAPGVYSIDRFHETLEAYRKRHPVKSLPVYDFTPPLEMAEELDKHNQLLQTALDDALKVIVELRNDVYQAQVDAQDWQNKYNSVALYQNMKHTGYVDHLKNRIDELTDQNTQFEVRNDRQYNRLEIIRRAWAGEYDGGQED